MERDVSENSSCGTLKLIRGSNIVSDDSPTVGIEGDCWPPYSELVTKNYLCGSSKLHVAVDRFEGKSALSFGLITPNERNEGKQRLTGKLCAWSSKSREIFSKDFDSETNYSGRRSITHFYNSDFKSGSNLCVEFLVDGKSNTGRVHFTINGEDQWVTFGNGAPKVWYGYLRLSSEGNGSKIEVTVVSKKNEETSRPCSSPPRGICLLINNVPNSGMVEKKFNDLFEYLSFHVEVRRDLGRNKMLKQAQKFAKKDHRNIDILAVVIMTISGQGNEIYCADGRNACLEHVMAEYTAARCPSLKGKPKLFFFHRFSEISSTANDLCLRQAHGSCAENYVQDSPHCSVIARDSCPEEADFLLHCVKSTSPTHENNGVPESFFIQMLDEVVRGYRHLYHLLEILTLVNKQMVDRRKDRSCSQMPYRTYTLREKVHLGLALTPTSFTSAVTQGDRYEMNQCPRGWCIIVNNVHFTNQKLNRRGAEEDEKNLKELFEALSFKVDIRRNLSSHGLEKVAQEFGAENHSVYNAFVFIVMSHGGDRDSILGVDGRETNVKNLMVEYLEDNCPSLKDKPKVFIIQACRGCRNDFAKFSSSSSADDFNSQLVATSSQAQIGFQPCDTGVSPDSTLPRSVFPTEANFVLAFSTAPGYVSHRNREHGAWFIQAMVEVIREYHHRHHLLDMLTEVTRLVVERRNSVQVPAPMDTLTKLLYL